MRGDLIVRREVWHGRVWDGFPMYVVEDTDQLLALYLPGDAPIGFTSATTPFQEGRHPWDDGPPDLGVGPGLQSLVHCRKALLCLGQQRLAQDERGHKTTEFFGVGKVRALGRGFELETLTALEKPWHPEKRAAPRKQICSIDSGYLD